MSVDSRPYASPISRAGGLRVFFGNSLAVLGLLMIGAFALMAVIHPLLMATVWSQQRHIYDPVTGYDAPILELVVVEEVSDPSTEIELVDARLSGSITASVGDVIEKRIQPAPPSMKHPLGTDSFGRDVMSMLMAGARPTFVVGLSAALVAGAIATVMASVSAVSGRRTDRVLSRFSDVALLLPAPLAMIILGSGEFGDFLTPLTFGILFGVLAGIGPAAVVLRSHALATVERPFMDSARVSGAGGWYLMRRHLVPHLVPLAAVTMVTSVVGAVVAHGFASWLAFSDEMTNWGAMMFIAVGFSSISGSFAWNVLLAGAGAISMFCASFYLVSLGLRDVAFRGGESRRPGRREARPSKALV